VQRRLFYSVMDRFFILKIGLVGSLLGLARISGVETLASEVELYTGSEFSDAFSNPSDDPYRPNVLLIGDSISIGYTVEVRRQLSGRTDVFRIPANGRDASYGLENLTAWLGKTKWDIIHFNWGLWDLCYRHPESPNQGHRDKAKGTLTATPEHYHKSLTEIVSTLKSTNAKLIWCATTPVPEFEFGRFSGDEIKYNHIAAEIMAANDIPTNDLHAHALLKLPEIQKAKGDVHFTIEGYEYLATEVARSIAQRLTN